LQPREADGCGKWFLLVKGFYETFRVHGRFCFGHKKNEGLGTKDLKNSTETRLWMESNEEFTRAKDCLNSTDSDQRIMIFSDFCGSFGDFLQLSLQKKETIGDLNEEHLIQLLKEDEQIDMNV
jgi:hypothetical protein